MCFGCGQDNPIGLKLTFQWDGTTVRTQFTPQEFHQGWSGLVHGGILICLLDEAMAYSAVFEGINCITARIQVSLKRPAAINEPLVVTSSMTKKSRKLVETIAAVALKDGTPVAEAVATHYVVSSNNWRDKQGADDKKRTITVIWDMDGVIADTAPYHFKAWRKVFRKKGLLFTEEDFRRSFGQRNDSIIRQVLGAVSEEEIDSISLDKEAIYRRIIRHSLNPLPGAIKLMKSLREHGFKMALASSTPMANVRLLIKGLGIEHYFQGIVAAEDVTEGKPNPQVFLLAAKKLEVKPENCFVIEDAVAGVIAAKRAGMHCIAVTNTHPRTSLTEADLIVDTLEELTVSDLEKLMDSSRKAHPP
jgi:beta-phosphoglucomutase family hydrolase